MTDPTLDPLVCLPGRVSDSPGPGRDGPEKRYTGDSVTKGLTRPVPQ